MLKREFVLAVGLAAALLTGCEKKEAAAPAPAPEAAQPAPAATAPAPAPAAAAATEAFSTSLPAAIAGKKFVMGGKAEAELMNKRKLDKIADVKSEEGFELEGWAIDEKGKSIPDTVVIELVSADGSKYYATASRIPRKRDDVAKFFKEPAYQKSGYKINADIKAVPPGEYEIIVVQLIDGKPNRAYPASKINKLN